MYDFSLIQKRPFLSSIVLFFLSLLPRLSAINRYITPDELIWVYRSVQFSEAIRSARWADTMTSGHPGVTITWIGAIAIQIQKIVQSTAQNSYEWLTHVVWLTPDNVEALRILAQFITAGRLGIICLNALGVVAIFWLTRRLFGSQVALLTAVFLALDPFISGLSSLLHVDATMTLFASLSLLCLAIGIKEASQTKVTTRFVALSCPICKPCFTYKITRHFARWHITIFFVNQRCF